MEQRESLGGIPRAVVDLRNRRARPHQNPQQFPIPGAGLGGHGLRLAKTFQRARGIALADGERLALNAGKLQIRRRQGAPQFRILGRLGQQLVQVLAGAIHNQQARFQGSGQLVDFGQDVGEVRLEGAPRSGFMNEAAW